MTEQEIADYRAGRPLYLPESGGNGHRHVAAEADRLRPLTAAELSSQQRNALVDSLVAAVNNHAKVLSELRTRHEALEQAQRLAVAQLDAHAGILLRPTFWARLRWILVGR